MEAIWDWEVDVAGRNRLLQTIWMALQYDWKGREGEAASMKKQALVLANASLILERAQVERVQIDGAIHTIFQILEASHQRGKSWPTLYGKEPEAIVAFIKIVISDILEWRIETNLVSSKVGTVPQGESPANDSSVKIHA